MIRAPWVADRCRVRPKYRASIVSTVTCDVKAFVLATPKTRIIVYLVSGLIILGAVLFTMHSCGNIFFNRDVNKIKANINAITANINAAEANRQADQTQVAIEKDRLREALVDLKAAQEATNQSTAATNAAIEEMDAARNANYANTSARELDAILDQLERP